MHARGVTRPMALQPMKHENADSESQSRRDKLAQHHRQTLWCYWSLIILGVWVAVAPFSFGYLNPDNWVQPSGGRGVWWFEAGVTKDHLRAVLMTWSDVISGLLLVVLGWRTLRPDRPVSVWACCFVGAWLTAAPVLFWGPTPAAYLSGTICGMLVMALTVLIPGMPNMILYMQHGPATPPGWSYNPSSWPQRWIMIVTGFAGFVVSRYLAAFQLGYLGRAWDPFFGDGTREVLNSDMSHMWPISDGGLGAISYTFEFLMGFMGSPSRWRTMPWMVTFFGILVIPLGLTHIILVMSQPVVVGQWCTMCLLAAAIMLPMIPLEVDEVVAMGQHLRDAKRRGDRGGSLWKIFWKGGSSEGSTKDNRSPDLAKLPETPWAVFRASVWGMSVPWTLLLASVLGIWMMAQPAVFGNAGEAAARIFGSDDFAVTTADVLHIGGAFVLTVAVISMGEVVRAMRWLILPAGLVVAVAPWLAGGEQVAGNIVASVTGFAVAALAVPRGQKAERYAGWDRLIR